MFTVLSQIRAMIVYIPVNAWGNLNTVVDDVLQ